MDTYSFCRIVVLGIVVGFCLQNELHFHDVIKLFRDDLQSEGPDGTQLVTLGTGFICRVL